MMTFFIIFQFIVPRFLGIFGAAADSLPAAARLLFVISHWMSARNLFIAAAAGAALIMFIRQYPKVFRFDQMQEKLIRVRSRAI